MAKRTIYDHAYRELVLPSVTAAALIGLLMKPVTPTSLSWWGAVFFVAYYAAQHTRFRESDSYGVWSFGLDCIGIGVFFWITRKINLFETGDLKEFPAHLFFAIFTIPFLSVFSRSEGGLPVRWSLVIVGLAASVIGLIASASPSGGVWPAWMMGLLMGDLGVYLVINFLEDGDRNNKVKLVRGWPPFTVTQTQPGGNGEEGERPIVGVT